ncbi:MAG TPA: metallophosphoesterase [Oceanithermus profundus]|uniref:Metallophosphoesterase n=1 Tax=Oceanithermus profundus TaxID=187137 RepID=A0A7C4Z9H5_9DEIN|nr:metallophosphoesterase [Oceanithermus profundus]
MPRIVAIGDVHAEYGRLWQALRHAGAADAHYLPTPALRAGHLRVVLIGDLVHPKTRDAYTRLTGFDPYDPRNPDHLDRAAREQIRALGRIKHFAEQAGGFVVVLRGNHDQAALDHKFLLGNASGIEHAEFDPERGGRPLPQALAEWLGGLPKEFVIDGIHFAHVGPAPWLQEYDDMFYQSKEPKQWWFTHPDYLARAGFRFGVYGHTVMKKGIRVFEQHGFALIDALDLGQYLELVPLSDGVQWNVVEFADSSEAG